MKDFKKILEENKNNIQIFHQEKNIKSLENILENLKKEYTLLKEDINEVIYLEDLVFKHNIDIKKTTIENEPENYNQLRNWIKSLKDIFEGLHNKSTNKLTNEEIEFLKLEVPKLINKKELLLKQMRNLDEIIAKTKALLMDLRNELCKEITKGYDLIDISKKIGIRFNNKLVGTYTVGRKKIINFLEETFAINKIHSKELIDLLDKSSIISFKRDIPENDVFHYYKDYGFADEFVPITGVWVIKN
jgi:hypothetical protein